MSTCTPYFKTDAQNAWVTQDGDTKLCIWLHSQSQMTLEDAATLIDNHVSERIHQASHLAPDQIIQSMSFRGQTVNREQMANHRAVDFMREKEPFSLYYRVVPRVSVWGLIFPCCAACTRSRDNTASAPQAQRMH